MLFLIKFRVLHLLDALQKDVLMIGLRLPILQEEVSEWYHAILFKASGSCVGTMIVVNSHDFVSQPDLRLEVGRLSMFG